LDDFGNRVAILLRTNRRAHSDPVLRANSDAILILLKAVQDFVENLLRQGRQLQMGASLFDKRSPLGVPQIFHVLQTTEMGSVVSPLVMTKLSLSLQ
jgi:hypothetical protein